ncbi:hypothetical protein NST41_15420 [Paenibacillus sp. FSL L8-0696]|uniref:hypothetical protein n=1 Tax=Paenibacillus sp. FSL L8-0696 TaxID=2954524 RepID=UPI00311A6157
MNMTPERIEEIKALISAATPGPWEVVNLGQIEIATNYRVENGMHVANWIAEMDVQEEDQEEQACVDAELIVSAVNSLPGLLAALEESKQDESRLQTAIDWWDNYSKDKSAQLEESQQQLTDSLERERGLKYLCNQSFEEKARANRELAEAQQTIARQRKALEFYATQGNHKWSHTYDETGEVEEIASKVANDRGRIAQAALGNKEGSDKA